MVLEMRKPLVTKAAVPFTSREGPGPREQHGLHTPWGVGGHRRSSLSLCPDEAGSMSVTALGGVEARPDSRAPQSLPASGSLGLGVGEAVWLGQRGSGE